MANDIGPSCEKRTETVPSHQRPPIKRIPNFLTPKNASVSDSCLQCCFILHFTVCRQEPPSACSLRVHSQDFPGSCRAIPADLPLQMDPLQTPSLDLIWTRFSSDLNPKSPFLGDTQSRRKRNLTHEWATSGPTSGSTSDPTSPRARAPTRAATRADFPVFCPSCPRKGPRVDGRGSPVLFSPVLFFDHFSGRNLVKTRSKSDPGEGFGGGHAGRGTLRIF